MDSIMSVSVRFYSLEAKARHNGASGRGIQECGAFSSGQKVYHYHDNSNFGNHERRGVQDSVFFRSDEHSFAERE